ncbi:Hemicentin-1 (Fibulin-6) (FIBL-6) [Durusdinium trenchii]|uniref:Hemicentin-1 (Fibulin-6) (FIBL-6) n=1 Tax=Durusdinium trenchii TaxID=1381693 RepID=A0ABP0N5X4_9DINO
MIHAMRLLWALILVAKGAPDCHNPLFLVHWPGRACERMCPSKLNDEPAAATNLTLCKHWNGLSSCCNTGLEGAQLWAHQQWKNRLGWFVTSLRDYAAGMAMRRLTRVYDYADTEMRQLFDRAADAVAVSTEKFAPCLLALLQYVAGMICFMCDPQWDTYLYASDDHAAVQGHNKHYAEGVDYTSIVIGVSACTSLWAGCEAFSKYAMIAWERVLQCPLAKQIEQPLPDLEPFQSKSALCEWARSSVALHPMLESRHVNPQPSLPQLPWDARQAQTTSSTTAASFRQLAEALGSGWGRWFLVAALQQPDKVMAGSVPDHFGAAVQLELAGGEELGHISHIAAANSKAAETPAEIFIAARIGESKSESITRYKYVIEEGKVVLSAAVAVWPAEGAQRHATCLATYGGHLFVADDEGRISQLSAHAMDAGARIDGVQLQEMQMRTDSVGNTARVSITGLAVSEDGEKVYWSTPFQISSSPSSGGTVTEVLSEEQLQRLAGDQARVLTLALAAQLFFVVHKGGTIQACYLYRMHLDGETVALDFHWPVSKMLLSVSNDGRGSTLFAATPRDIYAIPSEFSTSATPEFVFDSKSEHHIPQLVSLDSFYVRGTDCILGNWTKVGQCSRTCGGGRQRLERPVLTKAAEGGRPCPALREKEEDCFDQPCPEEATDCLIGQWTNEAPCSATCGYGLLRQRRVVLRAAEYGGKACPEGRQRSVDCIITECGGYDFLLLATSGHLLSAQVVGLKQDLAWTNASAAGSLPLSNASETLLAVDSGDEFMYVAVHGGAEILRWSYSIGDGHILSFSSRHTILDLNADAHRHPQHIVDMKFYVGSLYVAVAQGRIFRINEDALLSSNTMAAVHELYKDLSRYLGDLRSLSVAGTYLLWTQSSQVTLGSVDGMKEEVSDRALLVEKSLQDLAGSLVEVVQAELAADATSFFVAVWDTDQATLSVFQVAISVETTSNAMVEHQQLRELRQSWTSRDVRLMLTPFSAFVHNRNEIWMFPTSISKDTTPSQISSPGSSNRISGCGFFFQKGLDCKVSDWLNMSSCSASCGGGLVRQAREVLAEPSLGGQPCPGDLEREVACNEMLCPVDCKMSLWKDSGGCSRSCGGGTIVQTRIIESHPMYGGAPCSKVLEHEVGCNSQPCEGTDCIFSDWIDKGACSRTCGGGRREQYRKVLREAAFGGRPCSDMNASRLVQCNMVPCKAEGFDPIAGGRASGFDFDISDFCDPSETLENCRGK